MATEWADVSEHNGTPVDHRMTRPWVAFRANDGTYPDPLFHASLAHVQALRSIVGYIVYLVHPRSIGGCGPMDTFRTFVGLLGHIHRPKMVVMMDAETWDRPELHHPLGRDLETLRVHIVQWLNSLRPAWQRRAPFRAYYLRADSWRVIGYGNRGDLTLLAGGSHTVKWRSIILADYSNAPTPAKFSGWTVVGRQYTDHGTVGAWPHVDVNRSTLSPRRLARALGLGRLRWSLR